MIDKIQANAQMTIEQLRPLSKTISDITLRRLNGLKATSNACASMASFNLKPKKTN
jgi:hypothetical protein